MLFTKVHNALDKVEQQVSKFLAFESTSSPVFFVLANFRNLATKKKCWRIQQRDFCDF
jgi:hypothetical protein